MNTKTLRVRAGTVGLALLVAACGGGSSTPGPVTGPGQSGSPPLAVTCASSNSACVKAITAGATDVCALMNDGTLRCLGANSSGQLGDGTTAERAGAAPASGLSGVLEAALGPVHTCALLDDGTMSCWGDDAEGELGFEELTNEALSPTAVPGVAEISSIAVGDRSTWAVASDGTVRAWGDYTWSTAQKTPTLVAGLTSVADLAIGASHACARMIDGTVSCWGDDSNGDLGDGAKVPRATPAPVAGLMDVTRVVARDSVTCAIVAGTTLNCWGATSDGHAYLTPTPVQGLSDVRDVAIGLDFTCALSSLGTVSCWGANGGGQLGRDTSTERELTPAPIANLSNVVQIALGANHACALVSDGTVACWGQISGTIIASWKPKAVGF